jgi:hypothetical protein
MIEGTKKIETHCIEWTCGRCRANARLPQLAGATMDDVRDAIVRGHERRSFDCHFAHGIKHVRAVQDGKILRFTATREASMEQNTAGNTGPAKSSSPLSLPDTEYLERAFTYHPPKGDQPERYVLLRDMAGELAQEILTKSKPSRERSLAGGSEPEADRESAAQAAGWPS